MSGKKRLSHGQEYDVICRGRDAYEAGINRDEVPYTADDPRREAWLTGWDHGAARFRVREEGKAA